MALKQRLEKYLPRIIGGYLNTASLIAPRYAGNKAVNIFCTPRRGRLRPKDEVFLQDFKKETLQLNGLHIQCYVKGTGGPKILFAHGWESNAARWKPLVTAFEQQGPCTLIALDAPAHGASGGRYFSSLLYGEFLQVVCRHYRPEVLIGHSIGAASLVYYLTHLEAAPAQQLVLMGSPSDFTDISNEYIRMLGLNKRAAEALLKHFRERFQMDPEYYSIRNFAKKLTVGGWVVHDKQDVVSPYKNGENIANNWSQSVLMTTDGLGHSLNHSDLLKQIAANVLRQHG
jgi:pimeloyl-ACP methyl ester carboxylesterase